MKICVMLWLKLNNFHQFIFSRLLPTTGGFQGHWSYMLSNCPPGSLCNLYFFQLGGVCWFPHDFDNAGHYNNNKKKTPKRTNSNYIREKLYFPVVGITSHWIWLSLNIMYVYEIFLIILWIVFLYLLHVSQLVSWPCFLICVFL